MVLPVEKTEIEQIDVADALQKARDGDEAAMTDLMRYLHPLVIRVAARRVPRRSSLEDLIQSIFIKVFSKLDTYEGKVPLEHWVSRIAINTCLDGLRREKARPELRMADLSVEQNEVLENLHTYSHDLHPAHDIAARELAEELLSRLSPKDRLLVSLVFMEGHTYEEARQITGWSMPQIKVRLFRARKKLRKWLDHLQPQNSYEQYEESVLGSTAASSISSL